MNYTRVAISIVLLFLIGFDFLQWVGMLQNQVLDYFSLPISILILIAFLIYAYSLGLKRNIRQLYSELLIFVGAELGVAGGFTYEVCGPPPFGSCHSTNIIIGNLIGLSILIFGIVASGHQKNRVAVPRVSVALVPPAYSLMTQNDEDTSLALSRLPPKKMPLSLSMGVATGLLIAISDYWLVFYGTQSPVLYWVMQYGLISMALWFAGPPILAPILVSIFAYSKYHNTSGMARFLGGEFIMLTIGLVVFIVLVMFAAVFSAVATGDTVRLACSPIAFSS